MFLTYKEIILYTYRSFGFGLVTNSLISLVTDTI